MHLHVPCVTLGILYMLMYTHGNFSHLHNTGVNVIRNYAINHSNTCTRMGNTSRIYTSNAIEEYAPYKGTLHRR